MNTYASLSGGASQVGGTSAFAKQFLQHVPDRFNKELKAAIYADDMERAVTLCCGYVVKLFDYIPMGACTYYGEYVYLLLKNALQN